MNHIQTNTTGGQLTKPAANIFNNQGGPVTAILFSNAGTTTAIINGWLILAPGQSIALNQTYPYCDATKYSVAFTGAGNNLLCFGVTTANV